MDATTALERIDVIDTERDTENSNNAVGTNKNAAETVDYFLIMRFLSRICRISNQLVRGTCSGGDESVVKLLSYEQREIKSIFLEFLVQRERGEYCWFQIIPKIRRAKKVWNEEQCLKYPRII